MKTLPKDSFPTALRPILTTTRLADHARPDPGRGLGAGGVHPSRLVRDVVKFQYLVGHPGQ